MKLFKQTLALALMLFVGLSFAACSSDDDDKDDNPVVEYEPGKIPGLGKEEGELTGKPFELPDGIELVEKITGYEDRGYQRIAKPGQPEVKEDIMNSRGIIKADTMLGSGYHVILDIHVVNKTGKKKELVFPAGMIIRSLSGYYQNGLLVKEVKVVVPADEKYRIALRMYCANASKGSSSTSEDYEWAVISNASPIVDLCNRLRDKKINYEEFQKEPAVSPELWYGNIESSLQSIVWSQTDYELPLSEYYIKWIDESLKKSN